MLLETLCQDIRVGLRVLFKQKGFTAVAVLILALGIGANTAIFSLVHTIVFAPPAYERPAEIVQLFSQNRQNPQNFRPFSYPTYRDIREQNTVFTDVLAYHTNMVGLGEQTGTRRIFAASVSSNYFSVLGVKPVQGRAFLPAEETPGKNARVAIVSHNFWKKHSSGTALLDSTIQINGLPFTVVGIMPEGFSGTMAVISTEIWLPLGVYDAISDNSNSALAQRANNQLLLLGRLKPGLTAAAAAPALKTLATNLEKAFPVEEKDQTYLTAPLSRFSSGTAPNNSDDGISRLGWLLLGMVGLVLLVACLNLANLLLARGAARRKEIAIRFALGGGRGRIVRQLLTEGFVLSVLGGLAGFILALWSSDLLVGAFGRVLPFDIVWSTGPSSTLLLATLAFCAFSTLCFALGPALRLSRNVAIEHLKIHPGEDAVVRRRWRFLPRHPLVVVQIALSLALLTTAVLFIRGAQAAGAVDLGLKTDNIFLIEVDNRFAKSDETQTRQLYDRLTSRLAALPGVESVSVSSTIPFGITSSGKAVQRAGISTDPNAKPATAAEGLVFGTRYTSVGGDYFRTVGLPLLRGRAFTPEESSGAGRAGIAIIDEVLARKLWPEGDALGQRIQYPGKPQNTFEIIGIVPTTRTALFQSDAPGMFYLPFARGFQTNAFFQVKFSRLTPATEAASAALLRQTLREVDPGLPVLGVKTFAQHIDGNAQLWMVRTGATLFSVFGGLALGLAVIGVYGVKAYSVARRTREIGIRMALGARPDTVQWLIFREGAAMLTLGLVLGLLLSAGLGRILGSMLYQVGAMDPVAFTVAPLLLAIATLIACYLPARRATKVDPMIALRAE